MADLEDNRILAVEREYDDLEELHAQMNDEEEKLAILMSDLDMLRAQSDAAARSRQILEEEERAQQRRLEHVQLLQQLRKLQDIQPWAARQIVSESSRTCENAAPNMRSSAESLNLAKQPAVPSLSPNAGGRCNASPLSSLPKDRPRPRATPASQSPKAQPDTERELRGAPPDEIQCNSVDEVQAAKDALHNAKTIQADSRPQIGSSGASAAAAAAAAADAISAPAAKDFAAEGPKTNKRGNQDEGDCADGARGKKPRQNPMRFLCKFQLHGQCLDPTCPDIHLEPNPPPTRAARPAPKLPESGTSPAAGVAPDPAACKIVSTEEERAGRGNVGSPAAAAGASGGQGASRVAAGQGGAPWLASHHAAETSEEELQNQGEGEGGSAGAATLWRDFEAFSPRLPNAQEEQDTPRRAPAILDRAEGAAAIPDAGSPDSCGARQAGWQEEAEEDEDQAEEESLARLEEAWCGVAEDRYFGVRAQLSARRERARAEPSNIAAWVSLAQFFLQGHAEVSISQQLALNALMQGLESMPSDVELWHEYLNVLESQSANDVQEMMEVAVQKVPSALSLWDRLARSKSSTNDRLAVWQRAAKAALASIRVSPRPRPPTGCASGCNRRHLIATWIRVHLAAAACLIADEAADRRQEASRILSSAAARLPDLLTRCLEADRHDCPHAAGGATVDAEGERRREAERWVAVLEWLCHLSARAATSRRTPRELPCGASTRVGRSPTCACPGMGEGYEMIVSGILSECCGTDPLPVLGKANAQSAGVGAAARWLLTIAAGAQRESDTARGQGLATEAVEHAFNLLRSTSNAVALNSRISGGWWGNGVVSPLLAQHYVMMLRRASPSRGACTARARILADLLRCEGMQCDMADNNVRSWIWLARVLVVLAKDAVVAQLLVDKPDVAAGSSEGAEVVGAGGAGGGEEDAGQDFDGFEWRPGDGDEEEGKREMHGEGGLLRLHALLGEVLESGAKRASQKDQRPDSADICWQAAWASAECGYWMSRLGFANDPRPAGLALDALCRGLGCVLKWLQVQLKGEEASSAEGQGGGLPGAGTKSTGRASGRIMEAIRYLLAEHMDEDAPEEAGKRKQADGPRTMNAGGRSQQSDALEGIARDRAEEGLIWWLCRSCVLALMLEHQDQHQTRASSIQHQPPTSGSAASDLLDEGLAALQSLADCGATACPKCSGKGTGCFQLLETCTDETLLCRDGLSFIGRAAICSEWLHLAVFESRCSGAAGSVTLPKAALLRVLAQVRTAVESTRPPVGEGSHAGERVGGGGMSGDGARGEGGRGVGDARGRRRRSVAGAAWETLVWGDGHDAYSDGVPVHCPALQQVLSSSAGVRHQHQADTIGLLDHLQHVCTALPPEVALRES